MISPGLLPQMAIITSASTKPGMTLNSSETRISVASTQPR